MKVLMINKFLYPFGGTETYMLSLARDLQAEGVETQFFGMEDARNVVFNRAGAYAPAVSFHGEAGARGPSPVSVLYSRRAREKLALALDDFRPDIAHLHNYNFQLTPSILFELYQRRIPVVQTVHDGQMACPNHRFYIERSEKPCADCADGRVFLCARRRCVDNSFPKSLLAALESGIYRAGKTYHRIDRFLCPSRFMRDMLMKSGLPPEKLTLVPNRVPARASNPAPSKMAYALYFGRISPEKGIRTLARACRLCPEIPFVIAGAGPLKNAFDGLSNVRAAGYLSGQALDDLVRNAAFTVCPSLWPENAPLSILESHALGAPVIASDIGGIPELIDAGETGYLFPAGDERALAGRLRGAWRDKAALESMRIACLSKAAARAKVSLSREVAEIYEQTLRQ